MQKQQHPRTDKKRYIMSAVVEKRNDVPIPRTFYAPDEFQIAESDDIKSQATEPGLLIKLKRENEALTKANRELEATRAELEARCSDLERQKEALY